jgi:hypothetical protein
MPFRNPYRKLDPQAPIVLVGAGRSGSTLLDAMIESHPDVYSVGETSFLFHRLWEALVERKSYYARTSERLARHEIARGASLTWSGFGPRNIANVIRRRARREFLHRRTLSWKDMAYTHTSMDPYGDFSVAWKEAIAGEDERLLRELCESFVRLMIPSPLVRPHWMMREIWIGSPSFPYTYDLLLRAFPRARFVHCIRHPIDYLESQSKNQRVIHSDEQLAYNLSAWVSMVGLARGLSAVGSYFELRYEDLVADDDSAREALFAFLGLKLHPDCLERLNLRFVAGKETISYADRATALIDTTPGLRAVMETLDYADQPFGRLRPSAEIR